MKDDTRDTKIKRDQLEVFKILNGYENIDFNIYSLKIKAYKRTRGHNFMLVKEQSRLLYSVQNIANIRIRLIFDSSNTLVNRLGSTVYNQVHIYSAESTGASMERTKMPNLRNGSNLTFPSLCFSRLAYAVSRRHGGQPLPRHAPK